MFTVREATLGEETWIFTINSVYPRLPGELPYSAVVLQNPPVKRGIGPKLAQERWWQNNNRERKLRRTEKPGCDFGANLMVNHHIPVGGEGPPDDSQAPLPPGSPLQ